MRIWGVTVNMPTMNERASKTCREFVIARPMVKEAERKTIVRRRDRRRRRSPSGEMRRRPVAYLHARVEKVIRMCKRRTQKKMGRGLTLPV
jgi:hypothetical protein